MLGLNESETTDCHQRTRGGSSLTGEPIEFPAKTRLKMALSVEVAA